MYISTKKEKISWYFYDWANSAFYTTVIAVFLGPYLTYISNNAADSQGNVYVWGMAIFADSVFAYSVSISVFLQFIILPAVGAYADYSNIKKQLLALFAYIGAFSTMGLYFLEGNNFLLGVILFIIANVSFGASIVVYNAYLNEISTIQDRDIISSIGWAMGYLGGGILLLLNLLLYTNADNLGITQNYAIRISLCSAGVWWAIFTLIPVINLKTRGITNKLKTGENYLLFGYKYFFKNIKDLFKNPITLQFLIAYLFYNEGVQTIIVIAAQFARMELNIGMDTITVIILLVQFLAFIGSLLFGWLAKLSGTKNSILISLIIWSLCVIYSFSFLSNQTEFIILACFLGLVLGGTQALSRSLFSKLIPDGKEAEYFSIYEISDRGTSWIGPLLFGISLQLTNSYRLAILSLIIFFLIGIMFLYRLRIGTR